MSDFQTFELHDLDKREVVAFRLSDLPAHVEKFGFILGVRPSGTGRTVVRGIRLDQLHFLCLGTDRRRKPRVLVV